MLTWLKILCAVDFSESSRVALEDAADLARRFGAELTVCHVWQVPTPTDADVLSPPELLEATRMELQGKLETWRGEAERLAGRPVQAVLERGSPSVEILAAARNGHHDLIVTGTHARKGVRRLLLGSVAERIVREASCPVLVAHQPPDQGD